MNAGKDNEAKTGKADEPPGTGSRGHASVPLHSFSTRREVFFQRAPGTCILLKDDIGFGGPLEGLRFGVALGEPGLDGSLELGDAIINLSISSCTFLLTGHPCANCNTTQKKNQVFLPKTIAQICRLTVHLLMD